MPAYRQTSNSSFYIIIIEIDIRMYAVLPSASGSRVSVSGNRENIMKRVGLIAEKQ